MLGSPTVSGPGVGAGVGSAAHDPGGITGLVPSARSPKHEHSWAVGESCGLYQHSLSPDA